jgi:hypothetical protein
MDYAVMLLIVGTEALKGAVLDDDPTVVSSVLAPVVPQHNNENVDSHGTVPLRLFGTEDDLHSLDNVISC